MSKQGTTGKGRRDFIKLGGLGAAGSVALVAGVAPAVAAEAEPVGAQLGYRETEHVRKAYEVARF